MDLHLCKVSSSTGLSPGLQPVRTLQSHVPENIISYAHTSQGLAQPYGLNADLLTFFSILLREMGALVLPRC